LLLWIVAVAPAIAGATATVNAVDWATFSSPAGAGDRASWLESSGLAGAVVWAALTGGWVLLATALLYPVFQAMVLRWWLSGLRFGEVTVRSRLRTAQVFGVYARFFGYAALFTLVAAAAVALGAFVLGKITGSIDSMRAEIITTVMGVGAYVAIALGYSTIYQATVKLGIWGCVIETLDVGNLVALDRVRAAGEAASPIGEGLADALNVGGM
jgi:uncharacterized membrane protein YjgN (DUF898 family)